MKGKDMEPFIYSRNNSLRHFVFYKKTNQKKLCWLEDYIINQKPLGRTNIFMLAQEIFIPILGMHFFFAFWETFLEVRRLDLIEHLFSRLLEHAK